MIVGGAGGDMDPITWQQWIMAYKGWSAAEWEAFYKEWSEKTGFADKNVVLAAEGIRIFTWGGSTIEEATRNAGSMNNSEMLDDLSKEMEGMVDTTLMGWSKGGNLVMLYLEALAGGQNLVTPDHAVLIAPADTWISEFRGDIPNYGAKNELPEIGINIANVCVWWDPICDSKPRGTINFNREISGHGPHGDVAQQVFTALHVAYDRNAWNEYGWIWATKGITDPQLGR
jgi:hypothetical protein